MNIGVPAAISIPAGQLSRTVDVALPRDVTTGLYTIAAMGVGAVHTTTLNVDWAPAGTLRIVALLSNPPGDGPRTRPFTSETSDQHRCN